MAKKDNQVIFDPVSDYLERVCVEPHIDIRDYLAQLAVNSLISDIVFEPKDGADPIIQAFVDNITDIDGANDLIKVIRGLEWQLSRYGEAYAFFDEFDGKLIIGVAQPNVINQSVRINQQKEFAVVMRRVIFETEQGSYLWVDECRTKDETKRVVYNSSATSSTPVGIFNVELPKYITYNATYHEENENNKFWNVRHDYGVMSARQFLNLDRLYWGRGASTFADGYRAVYLEKLINDYLKFMRDEPNLNFTTRIGNFANQDINNLLAQPLYGDGWGQDGSKDPVKSKMFTTTNGQENVTIQQSTFAGRIYSEYLQHLISLYIRLSGYSFDESQIETYQNEASVNNVNKNVYETTKMKKRLREHDWYEFFGRMLYVYATKVAGLDYERAKELQKDIKNQLNFRLVSNLLNDYLNGDARVIELLNNGLLDREHAVRMVNEDLEEEEIDKIISEGEKREQSLLNGMGGVNIPHNGESGTQSAEISDSGTSGDKEE